MNTAVLHIHLALAILLGVIFLLNKLQQWRVPAALAALLLLLTGAHNFMTRMKDAPPGWHAGIGIKLLLGLHVIAIVFVIARGGSDPAKAARLRKGALYSLILTTLIGLYFSNFAR
jgi:hypothetical protein